MKTLTVHGFPLVAPLASPSPFCLKLETWLRLAKVPYEARADFSPLRSPNGKAPYVTLEDGTVVGDSEAIIERLSARPEVSLDAGDTDALRSERTLVRRVLEDHLYFIVLHERWVEPAGFAILKPAYFASFPALARLFVPLMARRSARKACHLQGVSRYDQSARCAQANADLAAIDHVLAGRDYFGGAAPNSTDATVYAFMANLLWGPFPGWLQDAAAARPALVAHATRVRDAFWV